MPDAEPDTQTASWRALVLLPLSLATFVSLIVAADLLADAQRSHKPVDWIRFVQLAVTQWYFWAALVPLITWWGRRHPLRDRKPIPLLMHVAFAFGLSVVHGGAFVGLERLVVRRPPRPSFVTMLHTYLGSFSYFDFLAYATILVTGYAFDYKLRVRRQELEAFKLQAALNEAHVAVLRSQLQPHFLFNTLHAIGGLIRRNRNEDALRMVVGLADLLRHSLDRARIAEVSLDEELGFLERYLQIQQTRFEDRLLVAMEVGPDVRRALVPSLILQPLVENALEHGVARRIEPTRVHIRAWRDEGNRLAISIFNDGPDVATEFDSRRRGTGLTNVTGRLERLFGPAHELALTNVDGGMLVQITMPWKVAEQ